MVAIRAIIISVLGSSQSGETQTLKETDNFLMTRLGSDAEFYQVAVSEFPASLHPTKCTEVIFAPEVGPPANALTILIPWDEQFHLLKGEKNRVGTGKSCRGSFLILQCRQETMRWKIQMAEMNT